MQASGKSALQYLKLFFLASFEQGNLTEQTARVSLMARPTSTWCTDMYQCLQASDSVAPQEKLRTWLRQKYEVLCGHLLEMLYMQADKALQVVLGFDFHKAC